MTVALAWTLAFAMAGLAILGHVAVIWYVRVARRRGRRGDAADR